MHRLPRWAARGAAVFVLAVAAAASNAATLPFSATGVDSTGAVLPLGSLDPHWQVVAGPGVGASFQATVVSNQHPVGQYFETATSRWIGVNAGGSAVVGSPYTFELQFDLTGFDSSTAQLSGFWGVDNNGSILLNGSPAIGGGTLSLGGGGTNNFNLTHAFTIDGGFVDGVNRLQVQVLDEGNPAGLNVFGLSVVAAPVPEPATAGLFLASLLTVVGLSGRRARRPG